MIRTVVSLIFIRVVRFAGLVHDVGKIGVPERVLLKPGRLTREEFDWIRQHPEMGYRILKDIPQLKDILPGVLYHHERWDGDGYPAGIDCDEYAPTQVKQAVCGTGTASKAQVQAMVQRLLALDARPPSDAADALAVAICHGHAGGSRGAARIAAAQRAQA